MRAAPCACPGRGRRRRRLGRRQDGVVTPMGRGCRQAMARRTRVAARAHETRGGGRRLGRSRPQRSDPMDDNDPGWTVFRLPSTPDGISIPDHPDRSGVRIRRRLAGAPEARSVHAASASMAPYWGILLRPRRRPSRNGLASRCRRAGNMLARLLLCNWSSWCSAKLVVRAGTASGDGRVPSCRVARVVCC